MRERETRPRIVPGDDPETPRISVIVPAYNSARTIARCLEALARQRTRCAYEIIVVHSGADNTCEVAQNTVAGCRTIQLPARVVPPAARHAGVMHARGDVLAFVDSDIYVGHDWIENVAKAAATGKDLICGPIRNANPGSSVSRAEQLIMFNEFLPDTPARPLWFALSGNMVISKRAYDRFGPFVQVRAAEDIVFSRKLLSQGGTIWFEPGLDVAHENRTRLTPFLKNQWRLGRHTATARRLVSFPDSRSHLLFLALLPISPAVKLAKIVSHVLPWGPRNLVAVVRDFPVLLAGVCVYCAGMASTVVAPAVRSAEPVEPVGTLGS